MKVLFLNPTVTPYRKLMRDFDCATESKGNYLYDFLLMSAFVPSSWELCLFDAVAGKHSHQEMLAFLKEKMSDVIVCSGAAINWSEDFATLKTLRLGFPTARLYTFQEISIGDRSFGLLYSHRIANGFYPVFIKKKPMTNFESMFYPLFKKKKSSELPLEDMSA